MTSVTTFRDESRQTQPTTAFSRTGRPRGRWRLLVGAGSGPLTFRGVPAGPNDRHLARQTMEGEPLPIRRQRDSSIAEGDIADAELPDGCGQRRVDVHLVARKHRIKAEQAAQE